MQWTLEDEITQPDPILNTSRELLYEDFDVSKDNIAAGFIDCLVLVPAAKVEGLFVIVEDKQGN